MAAKYFCDRCNEPIAMSRHLLMTYYAPTKREELDMVTVKASRVIPSEIEERFEVCELCAYDILTVCRTKFSLQLVTDGENN